MSIVAVCSVADLASVNADLEAAGFGPNNFSVPVYGDNVRVSHATLHCWDIPAFLTALQNDARVTVTTSETGTPRERVRALIDAQNLVWPDDAPLLPDSGDIKAGEFYKYQRDLEIEFWLVIQNHNRSTNGGDPRQFLALIRQARIPGQIAPWVQPIDQFDAYLTKEPFTGGGERVTHLGNTWLCTDGSAGGPDGSLLNTWEPGEFGWTDQGRHDARPRLVPERGQIVTNNKI